MSFQAFIAHVSKPVRNFGPHTTHDKLKVVTLCVITVIQISDFFYLCTISKVYYKEITIRHKNNIKTTLNYINLKGKMCAVNIVEEI